MIILAQRLIDILKANSPLTTELGSNANIFPTGTDINKQKYITVGISIGEDGNNIPINKGDLNIDIVVSRDIKDALLTCISITKKVDDLLNKKEDTLSDSTYLVRHFKRTDMSDVMFDGDTNEYFIRLTYEFIYDAV